MVVVPGHGSPNADLMIVGEAPGQTEAQLGRPFCGKSGAELSWYMHRHGLSLNQCYLDNVVRLYQPGNPDPTPVQIEEWTPVLLSTIAAVRPKIIVPVGRFAARWFLGESVDMDSCRGIPHLGGEFEPQMAPRAMGAVVLPTYHPAYALRSPEAKTLIDHDFGKVAEVVRLVKGSRRDLVRFRRDPYAGRERYSDVTGAELARLIQHHRPERVGYDTEGTPDAPWSLQVSWEPGTGYMLRRTQPDFHRGVEALQWLADRGTTFIVHAAGSPIGTCVEHQISRPCGLELRDAEIIDTMYQAFALRIEPKGLKPLLWRWCGMRQENYMSLVEGIAREKQIRYLEKVAARGDELPQLLALMLWEQMQKDAGLGVSMSPAVTAAIKSATWPRVPPRVEKENNGTLTLKTFGKLESRAKLILTDIAKDKRNKDGDPVDPEKRWKQLEPELCALAEAELGELPKPTLDDVPLDDAVFYGSRDSDGALRLEPELSEECRRMGVDGVCWTGNQVLPIFEEMQHNGMPASRRAFVDLATTVDREMQEIQAKLSSQWFGGKPFNPAPNTKDVEALVLSLGIRGLKTGKKSGRPSTSMKSLEHLASKYPAIAQVGEWRRRYKVLSTYCLPLIEMADRQLAFSSRVLDGQINPNMHIVGIVERHSAPAQDPDLFYAQGKIKPVTVETRRLAMEDPSLLNQPSRTEIGRKVRACYMTVLPEHDDPEDPNVEVFGGWDFSGQEVRVTAHVTGDRLLCEIMRDESRDIHYETASRVFGKPIQDIKKNEERTPAKTAFFGMLYGMSGPGLLDLFRSFGLENWPLDACERLIAEIFKIYPGLQDTINRVQQEARRTGMARDLYGHVRYLPNIWSEKRGEAAEAGRQAFSHLVQGTAQGMTQNAMASLRKPIRELRGLGVKWTLQIHDEILFRFPRWMYPVVDRTVAYHMTERYGGPSSLKLKVPVLVDGHMSVRWDALK